jgi:hypothetical protein
MARRSCDAASPSCTVVRTRHPRLATEMLAADAKLVHIAELGKLSSGPMKVHKTVTG